MVCLKAYEGEGCMKEKIQRLNEIGVATVYEAAGRSGLIDTELHQLLSGSKVAGPARTVACTQSDNLMVHACIEHIQAGDVVVLVMPKPEAVGLIGDLLVTQIQLKGAAGILMNGAIRDVDELKELGLPIWSQFIRAKGATKTTVGELNVSVEMGGTTINPNDIIIMDTDGATCVPQERLDEVLAKSEARFEDEEATRAKLLKGELTLDTHGLRKLIEVL